MITRAIKLSPANVPEISKLTGITEAELYGIDSDDFRRGQERIYEIKMSFSTRVSVKPSEESDG